MRYNTIKKNDCVDGDGITVSLFTQGCPHRCVGCHNPETWDPNEGEIFTEEVEKDILDSISKGGLIRNYSVLGGEPLYEPNLDVLYNHLKRVKETYPEIIIYMWSGYMLEDIVSNPKRRKVIALVDILIDGKFVLEDRDISLKFRGSPNQRILDVQQSLKEHKIINWTF